jgi:hypothetical protein
MSRAIVVVIGLAFAVRDTMSRRGAPRRTEGERTMTSMAIGDAIAPRAIDSMNHVTPADRGRVIVASSHGGLYCAYKAHSVGARGVVLNDAGVGKDGAGIASLAYCDAVAMPAATVAHTSARIGDVADMLSRGVVSHANAAARALGVASGMTCAGAWRAMSAAELSALPAAPVVEFRHLVDVGAAEKVVCIDSASLILAEDAGRVVVTGSHGGLIGGDPAKAINVAARFVAFNDAGVGIECAGLGRLAPLQRMGIAAVTVAHTSARIGDGASTLHDGVVSHANDAALALGVAPGRRLETALRDWLARAAPPVT